MSYEAAMDKDRGEAVTDASRDVNLVNEAVTDSDLPASYKKQLSCSFHHHDLHNPTSAAATALPIVPKSSRPLLCTDPYFYYLP